MVIKAVLSQVVAQAAAALVLPLRLMRLLVLQILAVVAAAVMGRMAQALRVGQALWLFATLTPSLLQHQPQDHRQLQWLAVIAFTNGLHQVQSLSKEKKLSHFAKVENGIVTQVIVAEQEVIDSAIFGHGWVQTSYNTHGGVHADGNTPLRKNYAGVGYAYDEQRDAFIPPQPYPSWTLSEETCLWSAPTPMPVDDKRYSWDEATLAWVEVNESN